jgi:NAD(P)-dependent dehydrogenase (short-subunit alcohol dehydrogenase family)
MNSERDIRDLMKQEVCVITGGGSGMGLATARLMGDYHVVIAGRTAAKPRRRSSVTSRMLTPFARWLRTRPGSDPSML